MTVGPALGHLNLSVFEVLPAKFVFATKTATKEAFRGAALPILNRVVPPDTATVPIVLPFFLKITTPLGRGPPDVVSETVVFM